MMSRALVVGIDHYKTSPLNGCVNDANRMAELLSRHQNGEKNFHCKVFTSDKHNITRHLLMTNVERLFATETDIVLLYFSGHGYDNKLGGLLVTQEADNRADGINLDDILTLANQATQVSQVFIILDCCHSGHIGNPPLSNSYSTYLRKNISILTSSQGTEESKELDGQGLFTGALLNGLDGGAADVLGRVTAASLYNYVDGMMGPWDQRPVFKSHINEMHPLRLCKSSLTFEQIRKITSFFPEKDYIFPLDPSYEPSSDPEDREHEAVFIELQRYITAGGLVRPVGAPHLCHAAMDSKACELTPQGRMYWEMVKRDRL